MRAPLPVFHRPPSTERDATIMRPPAHDASCLLVPRSQGGSQNGAMADYLVPLQGIEMHSSPSGGSAEHLLSKLELCLILSRLFMMYDSLRD